MSFTSWSSVTGITTTNASGGNPSSTVGTITLASGGGALLASAIAQEINPSPGTPAFVALDSEVLQVLDINTTTDVISVSRAAGNTTAASHANSTVVHLISPIRLFKALKAGIALTAPGS